MMPADLPETPTVATPPPAALGLPRVLAAAALLALAGAALGWVLSALLPAGVPVAPLATALAVVAVALPLLLLVSKLTRQLADGRQQLAQLDTVDDVTGASNRAYFLALADREWARARRYGNGAALLIVDIDRFHRLVETRGAEAGNAVLRALAQCTEATLRGPDVLARFGGAQLAVWLAHADPIGALDAAERIRERIESLDIAVGATVLRVTVSVGVCALRPAHQSLGALVEDAGAAVQAARQAGGNTVRAAPIDLTRLRAIGPSVGDNQAAGPA